MGSRPVSQEQESGGTDLGQCHLNLASSFIPGLKCLNFCWYGQNFPSKTRNHEPRSTVQGGDGELFFCSLTPNEHYLKAYWWPFTSQDLNDLHVVVRTICRMTNP